MVGYFKKSKGCVFAAFSLRLERLIDDDVVVERAQLLWLDESNIQGLHMTHKHVGGLAGSVS